jgi:hypothetical protein
MKPMIRIATLASMVIWFTTTAWAGQTPQMQSTNLLINGRHLLCIGVSTGATRRATAFDRRVADMARQFEPAPRTTAALDKLFGRTAKRAAVGCPIYCYNETVYDADIYFRSRGGVEYPRNPRWSDWWFQLTVPAGADGSPSFALPRFKWYQFYFTIMGHSSTISGQFKVRGWRKTPYGYLTIFYL